MVESSRRLVYAVYGNPRDPRTQSGVARALGDALERRSGWTVDPVDTSRSRAELWLAAPMNLRRGGDRWRWALHLGPASTRARTRRLQKHLQSEEDSPDVVLQLRTPYLPIEGRYVPYVDNTVQLALQYWRRAAPWRGRQLSKVLAYERAFFEGASHVFATGQLVADSLATLYGVPGSRISVVGAGSNYPVPPPSDDTRQPWILFVGYDFERKGGDRLVRAFRLVRRANPAARLKIVGPTPAINEPGVDVLGPLRDRTLLGALYAQSQVFALPVRYEPYGISFLEAMAHGLPCVGTNEGAVPEIIQDGETGYVVNPDRPGELVDALTSLLANPHQAHKLGLAGRRRVEQELNWDAVTSRMLDAMAVLVGDAG